MPEFVCKQCGRTFPNSPGNPGRVRKYCGRECANLGLRGPSYETGYKKVKLPGHPLAGVTGLVFEHRVVLWDKIGPGSHPCHHCGVTVTWSPGKGCVRGALVTDHLDRNRGNDDPDNLVPSCQRCNNLNKARTVSKDEPHVVLASGGRRRGEQLTCVVCGKSFVAVKRTNGWHGRGHHCSPECRTLSRPKATCQRCGKEFQRRSLKNVKYCGQGCYQAVPKPKGEWLNRVCQHCGSGFHGRKVHRPEKYCGQDCYRAARLKERNAAKVR